MINAGRRINLAIFTLESPVSIGDSKLQPGLQQIIRENDTYFFKKIEESKHYAEVPISENVAVLMAVFSRDLFTA